MTTANDQVDFRKVFDQELVRASLLLFSLYLTAFEILKSAIIEGIADWFIWETRTENDLETVREEWETRLSEAGLSPQEVSAILGNRVDSQETYESQVDRYEQVVGDDSGLRFDMRDRFGLIPSCKWLQDSGVLTETDTEDIREIREHRNRIAHGLPDLLVRKRFEVDIDHLQRIREMLVKVEVFWARHHISIDHPEIYEVPDEHIFSGRVFLMDQVLRAVGDYMEEVGGAA